MESSTKSTQHINIKFDFIKDCVIQKELNVKQCSTDNMLAYFPNKPLQIIKFKKFNKKIMGMNKSPKKTKINDKLQRNCMISELQNSTTGKKQIINNRVALHNLTGVCLIYISK